MVKVTKTSYSVLNRVLVKWEVFDASIQSHKKESDHCVAKYHIL